MATVDIVTNQQGPTPQTEQQNKTYQANGGANDDSGREQVANLAEQQPDGPDGPTPVYPNAIPNNTTPATQQGKSGTPAAQTSQPKPDKRWQNPLGNFSSYTYQLSLYMITPDAYDLFVQSGRKNINAFAASGAPGQNGAYLIAQSGGINNTTSLRAPGFDKDFFIDDLKVKQAINAKETGTNANVTSMSFTITEPYGFSFITRLRYAATQLATVTRSKNYKNLTNPTKQFYILGIRFQGYDANGNLINSKDIPGTDGDPQGNAYGIFERFYDIFIIGVKFRLEGKAVTYSITAASVATGSAFGVKRGIIDQGATIVAGTVDDALQGPNGLFTKLNNDQRLLASDMAIFGKSMIPSTWKVKYLGELAEQLIKTASIVSKADLDKVKQPMSQSKTTADSNIASAEKATVDPSKTTIQFGNGITHLAAVNQIIKQSSFMENGLKRVYTTSEDPTANSPTNDDQIKPPIQQPIRWYTMMPEVKCLGWDIDQSDFIFETTYIIQVYETPSVVSSATNAPTKYQGPHKRYEYWFTGKNSEIIKYEQQMDNTYFNVTLKSDGTVDQNANNKDSSGNIIGKSQGQPEQGRLNVGMEAQNSYMTSLFDPGAYARAKITILGDPDFLMQPSPSSINALYNKFYGTDGFTVNPNGGQVFIEINFREPTDYDNNTGLLGINESIKFWEYPADIQKEIDARGGGISYMVISCDSSFSKGKFEQELVCNINTFSYAESKTGAAAGNGRPSAAELKAASEADMAQFGIPYGSTPQTNTGFVQDDVTGVDAAVASQAASNAAQTPEQIQQVDAIYSNTGTIPTKTGQVQDDDRSQAPILPTNAGGRIVVGQAGQLSPIVTAGPVTPGPATGLTAPQIFQET